MRCLLHLKLFTSSSSLNCVSVYLYSLYFVGNLEMNDFRGPEEYSRSTVEPLCNSSMVPNEGENRQGLPRSAWVCCDDCHKWRRISAILADSIDIAGSRWYELFSSHLLVTIFCETLLIAIDCYKMKDL